MAMKRLPFTKNADWRFRWMVTKSYDRLHRIASGKREDHDFVGVRDGRTVCGLSGTFSMPGVFSRMGRERCAHCCRRLGIARGPGTPFNAGIDDPVMVMGPRP